MNGTKRKDRKDRTGGVIKVNATTTIGDATATIFRLAPAGTKSLPVFCPFVLSAGLCTVGEIVLSFSYAGTFPRKIPMACYDLTIWLFAPYFIIQKWYCTVRIEFALENWTFAISKELAIKEIPYTSSLYHHQHRIIATIYRFIRAICYQISTASTTYIRLCCTRQVNSTWLDNNLHCLPSSSYSTTAAAAKIQHQHLQL